VFGLSITEVLDAAATKPYGFMRFNPGPGAGGHCIPCDPHYLLWQLRAHQQTAPVITAAMDALAARPRKVCERVIEMLARRGVALSAARVLVVGVSYKPGVADTRESPAIEIIQLLRSFGADVQFHDPIAGEIVMKSGVTLRSIDAPDQSTWDLVVLHTVHPHQTLGWVGDLDVLDATFRADLPQRERV
jgi:nucleotide sugar dehydrogenase